MNGLVRSLSGTCGLAIVLGSGVTGCLVKRAESAASPQPPADEVWLTGRQVRDAQIAVGDGAPPVDTKAVCFMNG